MWRGLLCDDKKDDDIVVFGIAVDENCSCGRGTAEAPRKMRELSEFLPPLTMSGSILPKALFDLGDITSFDYDAVLSKMLDGKGKKLTLMLGGDHSVSILTQKAYRQINSGKRGIIHIDAHADICEFYDGSKNSHACVNKRALDNGFAPEDITLLGIRSYEEQEVEFLKTSPIDIYSADALITDSDKILKEIVKKYSDYDGVYLSFDIDAVDPAYAPGTGTPEAFGLPSRTTLEIISRIINLLPVDVMDIVEVSPPLDTNNITSWLALKFILEIIDIINKKHGGTNNGK